MGLGLGASRRGVADETSRRSATMTLLDGQPPRQRSISWDEMLQSTESHALGPSSKRAWDDANMGGQSLSMGWESHGSRRSPKQRIGRTTWCGGMNVTDQAAPGAAAHGQAQAQAQVATCPKCPSQLASHAEFVSCRLDSRIGPGTKGVRMSGGGGGGGVRWPSHFFSDSAHSSAELSCSEPGWRPSNRVLR
ncbi:hypothetical protein CCHR01_09963 [Colletotrichum chrysophilum]|uniref:Uncharacterized protein n=1 Tax=Colletotrichum chrysophilum TaxID=1836956 RepID=A0AAD9AGW3_9PEZI|nr:hypothetical protein CCHR01_09963 [Colletotrichum chrysophilum]